jgi:hypothetical protein
MMGIIFFVKNKGGSGGSKGSESGGSESGGSAVDSIMGEQNVSGRSSAYGDGQADGLSASGSRSNQQARSENSSLNAPVTFVVSTNLIFLIAIT